MKRAMLATLLLTGGMTSAASASAAMHEAASSVNIVAEYPHTHQPPKLVAFRAEVTGLMPPLRFHWNLGNGKEWEGPKPPPQRYDGGRYDVVVTVTDADGHVRMTSLTLDVEGEHEH